MEWPIPLLTEKFFIKLLTSSQPVLGRGRAEAAGELSLLQELSSSQSGAQPQLLHGYRCQPHRQRGNWLLTLSPETEEASRALSTDLCPNGLQTPPAFSTAAGSSEQPHRSACAGHVGNYRILISQNKGCHRSSLSKPVPAELLSRSLCS